MNRRIFLIAVPLVVALGLAAITLPGSASSAAAEAGGITVQGTASVTSVPDRAELSFGVESKGSSARAALSAKYNDKSEPQGFVATNTVSATIKELAKAGAVIDAAVNAGANQVYGPSLSHGDQDELYRQALKAAVANARANAQVLASAANVSLGRVTTIVEGGGAPQPMPFAAADKAMAESTPIEPGTQQTSASVTVTFSVS
jgi:uncharacterized protein YggE